MQPLPTQPPQPQSFWQRISALSTPQKVAAGIGAGCSALLIACLACSALSLALGGSNSPQGNGVVGIPATATATTLPTSTVTTPTATTHIQPTSTVHSQPTNTPHAQPTKTPCADPCNPWGYNFSCCNYIYSPPSNFCSYFNCIPSFWNQTNGYVEECQDATFSHSGGVSGSCSHHGGNWRPLYAP